MTLTQEVQTEAGPEPGPIAARSPRTSVDPTARVVWRRLRGPLAIVCVLVLAGILVAAMQGWSSSAGPLDPRSANRDGTRALAVLLEDRGVEVERVRRLADAVAAAESDTTVFVTQSELLARPQLRQLARTQTRHIVLAEPGEEVLSVLAPKVLTAGSAISRAREPGCDLPEARRAGSVRTVGPMYRAPEAENATLCYGDGTRGGLLRVAVRHDSLSDVRTVDVLGTARSFTNAHLAKEGNAALALNLLGKHERLVWYIPSLDDLAPSGDPATAQPPSLFSLFPAELRFAVGQVVVGIGLLLIAYARRLGPVVAEPLPVVVRASESVEGRARLYHRARARDHAASCLRAATRSRLATLLGLPPRTPPEQVAAAAAHRTGRPAAEVARILVDSPTSALPDDAALVRLARDLDTVEQEVRRT